jgi:sulfite exporter TauE/SafE
MSEKTKDIISYTHRILFAVAILIFMGFGDRLKGVMFIVMAILFVSTGIVGFVTNRNYRMHPTLPTLKGNISSIIENTIAILIGIGLLIFYIGFIKT